MSENDFDEELADEQLVPNNAFWHVESSLDNGYKAGMYVEVKHSENKYWLAIVVASCGQLLQLKWDLKSRSEQFWVDLRSRNCYPVGYLRPVQNIKFEPPPKNENVLYEDDEVDGLVDVTIKYFKLPRDIILPYDLFELQGKYPYDVFVADTEVEVAHGDNPEAVWLASVVENVGGRLKLKWVVGNKKDEDQKEDKQTEEKCGETGKSKEKEAFFWLYYCHPRIRSLNTPEVGDLGRFRPLTVSFTDGNNYSYLPPNNVQLIEPKEKIIERYMQGESETERKLVKYLIDKAKRNCPNLVSAESLKKTKIGDKVLIFSDLNFQLLVASVIKITDDQSHFLVKSDGKEAIQFWFPDDDNYAILPISWSEEQSISVDFGEGFRSDSAFNEYFEKTGARAAPIEMHKEDGKLNEFVLNTKLEVIHPQNPQQICEGVISRITPPLIWVELAADLIRVLPFTSTELFPSGWCTENNIDVTQLLAYDGTEEKEAEEGEGTPDKIEGNDEIKIEPELEPENIDNLKTESKNDNEVMSEITSGTKAQAKSWCPRIYFNHKCFTGPALSKSKICELPQYVGPGPVILVLQEVISKIISVAYVPNRILTELSSKTFNELLGKNKIKKTEAIEFKAKYQKRTYHDEIQVARNSDQVEEYCRSVCQHLKCCYNLFSPHRYSGDDCPSNCRGLTKSNKYLKRASYYREKAKYNAKMKSKKMTLIPKQNTSEENGEKKEEQEEAEDENEGNGDRSDTKDNDDKDSKTSEDNEEKKPERSVSKRKTVTKERDEGAEDNKSDNESNDSAPAVPQMVTRRKRGRKPSLKVREQLQSLVDEDSNSRKKFPKVTKMETRQQTRGAREQQQKKRRRTYEEEVDDGFDETFDDDEEDFDNPIFWSISKVYDIVKASDCSSFATVLRHHEVDGAALLLLDYETITNLLYGGYTRQHSMHDVYKLCSLIASLRAKWVRIMKTYNA